MMASERAAYAVLSAALALAGVALPQVACARAGDIEVRLLVVAAQESSISAPAAAQVAQVEASLGDSVRAGSALVQFECAEVRARREAALAEVQSARLQHEAKLRLQGLQSAAEIEVALAAAAVDRAQAQAEVVAAQLAQCVVRAPFDGKVARIHVKAGQSVTAGAPIVDVVGGGALKARINAPSRWLAWLRPGQRLEAIIEETGRRYAMRVSRIAGRVDAVSQTIEIETSFDDTGSGLLPGMSGRVLAPGR
ncbi:MAG: efflux RND transporter periplasmic adaptor subunit [Betaproteobacteria bacterium]|jgi:membrane fusion protein (multidrug efflux system)|nr:efflux RND transporter periplasmic adaptor subunit [Rhodocyclaceae bacterium]MCA3133375.1 efflux RND transporter periplasmic adaptor subunit [Rhodocyclaceae bacterium]MCA3143370.1 efflux RND transporter periplasmic adaptor subunit [Rhodocyclaceae bacterium]MCA3147052.1 efflux RND transporter periplasmic adaptor subunit [Rhodocyclaceae bacterium]